MDVAPWKTLRGCEEPTVSIFYFHQFAMSHINQLIETALLRHAKLVLVLKLLTPGKSVTEGTGQPVMVLVPRSKFLKTLVNSQFLFDSPKKSPMVISNYGT